MTEKYPSDSASMIAGSIAPPLPRTWWIEPGYILGGPFPGNADGSVNNGKLQTLFECGIRVFVNLQEPHEKGRNGMLFPDYEPELNRLATAAGQAIEVRRFPIVDTYIPTIEQMQAIQAYLRQQRAVNKKVFVHCWGGNGRTGTVAACWMAAEGLSLHEILDTIKQRRAWDSHLAHRHSPETGRQVDFVRAWVRSVACRPRHQ